MEKFEERFMVSREKWPLFTNLFTQRFGWKDFDWIDSVLISEELEILEAKLLEDPKNYQLLAEIKDKYHRKSIDTDLYIDGFAKKDHLKFGYQVKGLSWEFAIAYLTSVISIEPHRRGEFADSQARYHITAYYNEDETEIAAWIKCDFNLLREFISKCLMMGHDWNTKCRWIKENSSGKKFLRIEFARLLIDPRADGVVLDYEIMDDRIEKRLEEMLKRERLILNYTPE